MTLPALPHAPLTSWMPLARCDTPKALHALRRAQQAHLETQDFASTDFSQADRYSRLAIELDYSIVYGHIGLARLRIPATYTGEGFQENVHDAVYHLEAALQTEPQNPHSLKLMCIAQIALLDMLPMERGLLGVYDWGTKLEEARYGLPYSEYQNLLTRDCPGHQSYPLPTLSP